ncbi:hypothetical protein P5641_00365 (plasmid) [Bacillus subtilis]|uniref:hypothetical protein n=1 Tax=Bacillus subtilis TaxID=1423 RepID=UPI00084A2338|nr:hypothetical protein [Bacillus subtilis]ODV47947.1 hypothetical protein BCM26_05945 [Bacillus subtilis]OJH63545.1 hypothetical protein BOH71_09890 [Bacillus subtilis]WEY94527.1 hypothetical protein P5641_00365 [Bacillus subtilis]
METISLKKKKNSSILKIMGIGFLDLLADGIENVVDFVIDAWVHIAVIVGMISLNFGLLYMTGFYQIIDWNFANMLFLWFIVPCGGITFIALLIGSYIRGKEVIE